MDILKKISKVLCLNDEAPELKHPLKSEIFHDYYIRGIYKKTLYPEHAHDIGRAFGSYLYVKNLKKVCVGNDCRNSSDVLASELIKGLTLSGMEVTELGVCHTPMMYYTVNKFNMDAGIMVTGSHDLRDYNGFKFMLGTEPFYGEDLQRLRQMTIKGSFVETNGREIILNDIFSKYVNDIIEKFTFPDDVKIAWDIGNGSTSNTIREIITRIPGRHHVLFEDMNGDFPNRAPDPTVPANIQYIRKLIEYNEFDAGFAFDSDGDRLCVINSEGKMLYNDHILEIFARDFLTKNPGAQVVSDVRSCSRLSQTIKQLGGAALIEPCGLMSIKAKMKSSNALLAGEVGGHFCFKDHWYGFEDGIFAALRCLEIFGNNREAFQNPPYEVSIPEIQIPVPNYGRFEKLEVVKNTLSRKNIPFMDIDGIRVCSENGEWLLRASKKHEYLAIRALAYKADDLPLVIKEIVSYTKSVIEDIKQILSEHV